MRSPVRSGSAMSAIALSFVIPLYKSAETIAAVVRDIESLEIEGGHEIVLVNDGSADRTSEVVRALMPSVTVMRMRTPSLRPFP